MKPAGAEAPLAFSPGRTPDSGWTALAVASVTRMMESVELANASGADGVINDLKNKGYDVQINWVNGFDTERPGGNAGVTGWRQRRPSFAAQWPRPGSR